jgi:AraC-like DNA-binding protein
MFIVAMLPVLYARRLARALPGDVKVAECTTLADCQSKLERPVDCVIVDPLLLGEEEIEDLLRIIRCRREQLIFYTKLTNASIRRMLPSLREGAADIIVADMEDYPERLCQTIHSLPSISVRASLVSALAPAFPRLNPTVGRGLLAVLIDPSMISAKELRDDSSVSRRTIERDLTRARLAPLHRWWSVSRLARSFTALAETEITFARAARLAGYASPRSLNRQYLAITHVPLAEVRHKLSQQQFVERAAHALLEPSTVARP